MAGGDGLAPELRRWAVAAIFTTLALASLDTAIANIALPAIAADLHVSAADVVWVVNVYQIALVATFLRKSLVDRKREPERPLRVPSGLPVPVDGFRVWR